MGDLTKELTSSDAKWYEPGKRSKYEEICDLADIVKKHRWNYTNNKILWDTLSVCSKDDQNLSEDLKVKIRNVLCACDVESCMNLGSNNVDLRLLGLPQIIPKDTELLYEEHGRLKDTFENALVQLCNHMQDSFKTKLPPENSGLLKWSLEDKVLQECRNKLIRAQGLYIQNLFEMYKLLEEVLQLRVKDVKEMCELKIKEYDFKLQQYTLQTELLTKNARVNIFTETSHTFDAYNMLIADISKEQSSCEEEVEKLKLLKEQYKQVACKQYDEILRDYISYKHDLETKRTLMKNIKSQ